MRQYAMLKLSNWPFARKGVALRSNTKRGNLRMAPVCLWMVMLALVTTGAAVANEAQGGTQGSGQIFVLAYAGIAESKADLSLDTNALHGQSSTEQWKEWFLKPNLTQGPLCFQFSDSDRESKRDMVKGVAVRPWGLRAYTWKEGGGNVEPIEQFSFECSGRTNGAVEIRARESRTDRIGVATLIQGWVWDAGTGKAKQSSVPWHVPDPLPVVVKNRGASSASVPKEDDLIRALTELLALPNEAVREKGRAILEGLVRGFAPDLRPMRLEVEYEELETKKETRAFWNIITDNSLANIVIDVWLKDGNGNILMVDIYLRGSGKWWVEHVQGDAATGKVTEARDVSDVLIDDILSIVGFSGQGQGSKRPSSYRYHYCLSFESDLHGLALLSERPAIRGSAKRLVIDLGTIIWEAYALAQITGYAFDWDTLAIYQAEIMVEVRGGEAGVRVSHFSLKYQ